MLLITGRTGLVASTLMDSISPEYMHILRYLVCRVEIECGVTVLHCVV